MNVLILKDTEKWRVGRGHGKSDADESSMQKKTHPGIALLFCSLLYCLLDVYRFFLYFPWFCRNLS